MDNPLPLNVNRLSRTVLFAIILVALFPAIASAGDTKLPTNSPATVTLTGKAIAGDIRVNTAEDSNAYGDFWVAPRGAYLPFAKAPLPTEGDTIAIWIHYRGLAMQMKTRIDTKVVEFPWNWNRHPDVGAWRKVGTFNRDQLGSDGIWFIADPKTTPESGVDALILTSDLHWSPISNNTGAIDLSVPDAASATVSLPDNYREEAEESGTVEVVIDWNASGDPVPPAIYSLNNFHAFDPVKMADPNWHSGIAYMSPALLRLHFGGLVRTCFDEETQTWDYDRLGKALVSGTPPTGSNTLPIQRMMNINTWPRSWDKDGDGRLDPDKIDDFARLCADLVRFANQELQLDIRYWEVTNEKDFAYWRRSAKGRTPDVAALAEIYNTAAAAMRAVDPDILIGGPAACSPLPVEPLLEFVRLTIDQLDFFSFHNYASGVVTESDRVIYDKVAMMAQDTESLIRLIQNQHPERNTDSEHPLEFHLNEYNICYSWKLTEPRMTNHKGAVFDALSLIAYANIDGLSAANAWNDMDRTYGKMSNQGELRPGAHTFHFFNNLLQGNKVSATTSNDGAVVPFAIQSDKLAFVLVNRTNAEQHVELSHQITEADTSMLEWHQATIAETGLHSNSKPQRLPTRLTLAPHSVNFYWQETSHPH